ncbi:hypothetical protein GCM10010168_35220 [Actinoplanes ianthinogenes]|uniref:KAP NTPase domain-containing protein n=1 Tax=Actinoplanes ianthinogenes TaxID=122358 RepID=A0ABM7M5T6_9ACTN|nr:P-loop NTPase fold protein [Actinoplanes ianthinogenes]BCJ46958.1 hypothetical protein Aiant_76150 [Actinoplanes ianthinogenes]GGR14367.1 hypothetical protein GCM10010168_35220 [Actinoplanes ianthinogenes]
MAVPPSTFSRFSASTQRALRWAGAAAACRESGPIGPDGPAMNPFDLLVGLLLAHPDAAGEAFVVLDHFGLTARDVLPPNYPALAPDQLQHQAAKLVGPPHLSPSVELVVGRLPASSAGPVPLYLLLGALLGADTELTTPLRVALAAAGDSLDAVRDSYERWLRSEADKAPRAGDSLRDWLRRANPRQPVDLPAYASDRIDAGHDLIGIAAEADAFAYLLASRDLTPPLAIGLFGDWGSGKSFLMQAVKDRINQLGDLVGETGQQEAPVWKQIRQIEFNAWEYVQGDLWAGLLEHIFGELGTPDMPTNLVDTARRPLEAELRAERTRGDRSTEQLEASRAEVETATLELAYAENEARDARDAAPARTEELLADQGRRALREAFGATWAQRRLDVVGHDGAALLDAVGEAKTLLRKPIGPYWQKRSRIVLLSLGAALIPLVAWLLTVLDVPPLVSLLGGLAAVVPVATSAIRGATGWAQRVITDLEAAETAVRDDVAREVAEKEQTAEQAARKLEDAEERLAAAQTARDAVLQRATSLLRRIEELTPDRVFVEFADERSSDYRRRLGLLSRVRQDLLEIQEQLRANNNDLLAGKGNTVLPNRIVLYVDDLDRCPPDKVVEVLEAVHLLLAFEMFVVVVAVDTRWLSAALTDQLPALTETGQDDDRHPAPRHYLEKIFQLPYWVQPLTPEARMQLVRGLLAASLRSRADAGPDPSGGSDLHVGEHEREVLKLMLGKRSSTLRIETSQLTLTLPDLEFIESLAPLAGDTPRQVKRFVNTCQLLLAMRPPLKPAEAFPPERHVVCLLAAINAGPSSVADLVFARAAAHSATTLGATADEPAGRAAAAWGPLRDWLGHHQPWRDLPIEKLSVRLEMVRRLRFEQPGRI